MTAEELDALVSRANHEADLDMCGEGYISPTVVWGMIDAIAALRAERDKAEASLAAMVRDAVQAEREAIAQMIEGTAYTSNGDGRSLEPVSAGLVGMDMHHATIAAAIRARGTNGGGE